MRVKQIKDIPTALRIYYTYSELGNKQISELFGGLAHSTIPRYKKAVKEEQIKNGILTSQRNTIDTETAYKVWGLDVEKMEVKFKKLKKLEELGLAG